MFIVDESDLLDNIGEIADFIDPTTTDNRDIAGTRQQVGYLFDGNAATSTDFRLGASGAGAYIGFDFREENAVRLSGVELLARQDNYYTRLKGTVVQGSNDNETWTTLTAAAVFSTEWQTLAITVSQPYRYLRVYNESSWFGNMAELRLHASRGAYLHAPDSVPANGTAELVYGLDSVTSSVYSTALTLNYDPSLFRYMNTEPITEGFELLKEETSVPGQVKLMAAGQGRTFSGAEDLLAMRLVALNPDWSVTSSVYLSEVAVTDDAGVQRVLHAGSPRKIRIDVQEEPPVIRVTGVKLDRTELVLEEKASYQMHPTVTPADAANREVLWTSSNPTAATVDSTGRVLAVAAGKTVITATTVDGGYSASTAVKVIPVYAPEPEDSGESTGEQSSPPSGGAKAPADPSSEVDGNTILVKLEDRTEKTLSLQISAEDMTKAAAGSSDGAVIVRVNPPEGAESVRLSVPVDILAAVEGKNALALRLDAGWAAVVLSGDFLKKQDARAVEWSVAKQGMSSLSTSAQERLKDNQGLYEFSLSVNGVIQTAISGNSLTVAVPYALRPGGQASRVVLYHISDTGDMEPVKNGRYNARTGDMEFRPKRLGKYATAYSNVSFTDLGGHEWAKEAIEGLAVRDIVEGTGEGFFQPEVQVTRAQFIAMLIRAFDWNDPAAAASFNDVRQEDWYYSAVASAQQLGIIHGMTEELFGVEEAITRQDMAVILHRAIRLNRELELQGGQVQGSFTDQADISGYAAEAVVAMQQYGIVEGIEEGRFAPMDALSRGQAAAILFRMLYPE
ncbi:Endo-1,4-beta-xylanase A precursor [compost metagenome]